MCALCICAGLVWPCLCVERTQVNVPYLPLLFSILSLGQGLWSWSSLIGWTGWPVFLQDPAVSDWQHLLIPTNHVGIQLCFPYITWQWQQLHFSFSRHVYRQTTRTRPILSPLVDLLAPCHLNSFPPCLHCSSAPFCAPSSLVPC